MLKSIIVACVLVACTSGVAFAQSACSEPIAPAAIDGSKATESKISDASHDANQFMKDSDTYQGCLMQDLRSKQAEAAKQKKPLDPSYAANVQSSIDENQTLKEKVGTEFQSEFLSYCKAHPTGDPSCKKLLAQ
jgi:hypothetical protein